MKIMVVLASGGPLFFFSWETGLSFFVCYEKNVIVLAVHKIYTQDIIWLLSKVYSEFFMLMAEDS